jgi:hypothetical protein
VTRDETLDALRYWDMRSKCKLDVRGGCRALRKVAACWRLLGIIERRNATPQTNECEGQLLRYRWDELPMPPKGKTA